MFLKGLTKLLIILCLFFVVIGNFCSILKKQTQEEEENNFIPKVNIGDHIKFGNYPQTSNGDIQPIEWMVLAIENNEVLVISCYGLDSRRFDDNSNDWKNSEIRQWLNNDFYNIAFNENEKKYIKSFEGDNIFFLSKEEAEKYFVDLLSKEEAKKCYFPDDKARQCKATDYAVKNGAYVYDGRSGGAVGCSSWWLRSPSPSLKYNYIVYFVVIGGSLNYSSVYQTDVLVRPALWINLQFFNN